ncbi:MAG: rhodanese-like domain-containing protein [Lachnospiraceae bacterium]|nr:rhodanese-like domain-containing protein [Lachnospiraceae bacterium]
MGIRTVNAFQFRRMLEQEDVYVVDVREPQEYQSGHIPQAHNYPYDSMERWIRQLPKRKKILLVCEYGNQSMMAARRLQQEGIEAYSLIGGLNVL